MISSFSTKKIKITVLSFAVENDEIISSKYATYFK